MTIFMNYAIITQHGNDKAQQRCHIWIQYQIIFHLSILTTLCDAWLKMTPFLVPFCDVIINFYGSSDVTNRKPVAEIGCMQSLKKKSLIAFLRESNPPDSGRFCKICSLWENEHGHAPKQCQRNLCFHTFLFTNVQEMSEHTNFLYVL